MRSSKKTPILDRIDEALRRASEVLENFTPGNVDVERKSNDDPVTAADRAVDDILKEVLLGEDEGWLSEETVDDLGRLNHSKIWVVDPLDGTREFVAGIPEWAVSIGYVEDGRAIAGGVCNPQSGETFMGMVGSGVTYNGRAKTLSDRQDLRGAVVLASRSEVKRGEWERFRGGGFEIRPVGSVAYKLALVAAGLADATWTLVPKHEWDIAAGVALVHAAGGAAYTPYGNTLSFNNRNPLIRGLVAHAESLEDVVKATLAVSEP